MEMEIKLSKSIILLFTSLIFLVACNSIESNHNDLSGVQTMDSSNISVLDTSIGINVQRVVDIELTFTKSDYGKLPAVDIAEYKEHLNDNIAIRNDSLYFDGSTSRIVELTQMSRDSVLIQFRNEPKQQDVFKVFESTLKNEKIWVADLDLNHIPFHTIYFDSISSICYMNGIISTGKVSRFLIGQ